MKNTSFLICLLLALISVPSLCREPYRQAHPVNLDEAVYNRLFAEADRDSNGKLTEGEVEAVFQTIVREIFRLNNFYHDEELIQAIVKYLVEKYPKNVLSTTYSGMQRHVSTEIADFREKIFSDLFKVYGVENLMDDPDISAEVYNSPDVYGLTYAAHKVLFFDFDEAARQAGFDTKKLYESLEKVPKTETVTTETVSDRTGDRIRDQTTTGTRKVNVDQGTRVSGGIRDQGLGDDSGIVIPDANTRGTMVDDLSVQTERVIKETITQKVEVGDVKTTYGADGKVEKREGGYVEAESTRTYDL